jgi:hypothetical protein
MTRWERFKCWLSFHHWYHTEAYDIVLKERAVRTCLRCHRIEMFVQETAWTKLQGGDQ